MAKQSKKKQSKSTTPSKPITRSWWPIVAILLVTALLYLPSLSNDFVNFDDDKGIVLNERIQDLSPSGLKALLTTSNLGMYAPVAALGYALVYQVGELNPTAYHVASLLLHLANVFLIWLLFSRLSKQKITPIVVALLFAVHPLQVESLSWASAMSVPLYSLFYLLGLWFYTSYLQSEKKSLYGFVLFFFVLSLLTKSAAVTLPLVLLLLDYWYGRAVFSTKNLLAKLPFIGLSIGFGLLTIATRNTEMHSVSITSEKYNLFDRLLMLSDTIVFYIGKIIAPISLSLVYPFAKSGEWSILTYLSPLLLIGLLYALWKTPKAHQKAVYLGVGWFLFSVSVMLPWTTVGSFELCADRYNYLAMAGIFFLLAYALNYWITHKNGNQNIAYGIVGVLAIAFSLQTFQQTKVWENGKTLFTNLIEKKPDQPLGYMNRGLYLLNDKQAAPSIKDFSEAIKLEPLLARAYEKRGVAYYETKQPTAAIKDLQKAVEITPANPYSRMELGRIQVANNQAQAGIQNLEKATELGLKEDAGIYYQLGIAYGKLKQRDKAIQAYAKAVKLQPSLVEVYINRANIYAQQGQFQQAIQDLNKAETYRPSFKLIFKNRGSMYEGMQQFEKAIEDYTKAISLDENYAQAYQGRARAYQRLGNTQQAQQDLQMAQRLSGQ